MDQYPAMWNPCKIIQEGLQRRRIIQNVSTNLDDKELFHADCLSCVVCQQFTEYCLRGPYPVRSLLRDNTAKAIEHFIAQLDVSPHRKAMHYLRVIRQQ